MKARRPAIFSVLTANTTNTATIYAAAVYAATARLAAGLAIAAALMIFPAAASIASAADQSSSQPGKPAQQQPNVVAIEIRGLRKIEEGAVRKHISQGVGLPLSPEAITRDIKDIFETGYFDDVKVDAEPFEGGIKLIYIVKEKPSIVRVEFSGNKELGTSKITDAVKVPTGAVADTVLINDNVIKLRHLYEDEGFGLAQVVPIVHKLNDFESVLVFMISEGPKAMIKKISFTGNRKISSKTLRKAMTSSERGLFSFLSKGGYYKKNGLQADEEKIADVYFNQGYLQASVSDPQVTFSPDKKWAFVTYDITEGPQFKLSSVSFTGNKVFSTPELEKGLKIKTGKPLSRAVLRMDIEALTEKYAEKGYALASISPNLAPDPAAKTVSVSFDVAEGDQYHIGRIEISGNEKTKDHVIRREITLNEGDLFNSKKLKKSYQNINNLNFFDTVAIQPEPIPDKKLVNLDVNVKEKATGFFSVGGGYSSVDKIIGMVDITQSNLGGTGRAIKLKGELGSVSSDYEFTYHDPWFLNRNLGFTASVYKSRRIYLDYSSRATGFSVGLSKNFKENWWISADYKLEDDNIYNVLSNASPQILDQAGTKLTSAITPSLARDTRDNYLDPHTGSRNSISMTFAGLGGDNDYLKAALETSWYLPVTENTTLALSGALGYSTGLFGKSVPLYERFYVGGIYTVMGLGYGEGGPRDINDQPIGGLNEAIADVDYIFPIVTALKFKGEVFFDTGSAYDTILPRNYRYTTGAGIRWISPIGPIRIDWGVNIRKNYDEKRNRFEFTFGGFF